MCAFAFSILGSLSLVFFVCLFTLQMQRFLSILEGTGAVLLLTSATFLVIGAWVHTLEGVLGILFSDSLLSF